MGLIAGSRSKSSGRGPIPLFDLRLEPEDIEAVVETLRSGWLTMGPRTEAFEDAFARHLGCRHAIAVSNCTGALHLAYKTAGVQPGDEVIVPSFTFVATASAVSYCGARPVFADIVGPEQPSIDPVDVERRITPRTKAVCAVHFAGYGAAVDVLEELCRDRGVALIEDAAHAPSAELGGRKIGTFGHASVFSFFSNKVLSVGEGGLLATDDDDIAAAARRLRSHGMTSNTWDRHRGHADAYDVIDIGFNYRLDEVRAALGLARLQRLDAEVARRRQLTLTYRRDLRELSGLILPYTDEQVAHSSCYVMPIMLADPARQGRFRSVLRSEHGVQTSLLYPAVHELSAYRRQWPDVSLPRTEQAARSEVTIPLYPHMNPDEQAQVLRAVREALAD